MERLNYWIPVYILMLSGGGNIVIKEQDGHEVRVKCLPSWLGWMPVSDDSQKVQV